MRRFPVGLTVAAGLAFAILVGLGVWQLQRLTWKEGLLAKVAALRGAPAQPIGRVLARAARGEAVGFVRVRADCAAAHALSPTVYRYALRDGQVGWRLMSVCALAGAPYDGVLLDRGLVARFAGAMAPAAATFPEPAAVTGVLRSLGAKPLLGGAAASGDAAMTVLRVVDAAALKAVAGRAGLATPAPYLLAVEAETPALAGVTPAALPQDIPNNHLIYALTWFVLAGVLAWIYGATVVNSIRAGP